MFTLIFKLQTNVQELEPWQRLNGVVGVNFLHVVCHVEGQDLGSDIECVFLALTTLAVKMSLVLVMIKKLTILATTLSVMLLIVLQDINIVLGNNLTLEMP